MKVLLIDNNPNKRKKMNAMMHEQGVIDVTRVLEAPNRIMGFMLIEAVDFDLTIIGGGLSNTLPDGSHDEGDGIALVVQLLKKNHDANVVLWSDKSEVKAQFQKVLMTFTDQAPDHLFWQKKLSLQEVEQYLLFIYPTLWQDFSAKLGPMTIQH